MPSGVFTPVVSANAGVLAAVIGRLYASTRPVPFATEAAYKRVAFTPILRYAVLLLANGKLITFGVMIGAPVYGGAYTYRLLPQPPPGCEVPAHAAAFPVPALAM